MAETTYVVQELREMYEKLLARQPLLGRAAAVGSSRKAWVDLGEATAATQRAAIVTVAGDRPGIFRAIPSSSATPHAREESKVLRWAEAIDLFDMAQLPDPAPPAGGDSSAREPGPESSPATGLNSNDIDQGTDPDEPYTLQTLRDLLLSLRALPDASMEIIAAPLGLEPLPSLARAIAEAREVVERYASVTIDNEVTRHAMTAELYERIRQLQIRGELELEPDEADREEYEQEARRLQEEDEDDAELRAAISERTGIPEELLNAGDLVDEREARAIAEAEADADAMPEGYDAEFTVEAAIDGVRQPIIVHVTYEGVEVATVMQSPGTPNGELQALAVRLAGEHEATRPQPMGYQRADQI